MQPPTKTKGVENTPRPLHTQCFLWPLSRTVIIAATVRLSESLVLCFVSHLPFVCRVRVPSRLFCGLLRWSVVLHDLKLRSRRQARVSVCRLAVRSLWQMFCGLLRWGVVPHDSKLRSRCQARVSVCRSACRVPRADVLWFAPLECCASRLEVVVPL